MTTRLLAFVAALMFSSACATVPGAGAGATKVDQVCLTRAQYSIIRRSIIRRKAKIKKLKAKIAFAKSRHILEKKRAVDAMRARLVGCLAQAKVKCPKPRSCAPDVIRAAIIVGAVAIVVGAGAATVILLSAK